jgi:hypothetical protein
MPSMKFGLLLLCLYTEHLTAAPMPDLKELFLEVPMGEHLELSRSERSALITLVDAKNGFLQAKESPDKNFAGGQLALFKKKDGGWLIGWRREDFTDSAPVVEMFVKEGPKWVNVSKEVLPTITNAMIDKRFLEKAPKTKQNKIQLTACATSEFQWNLPRRGTTLTIEAVPRDCWSGPKLLLWNLTFNGKTFDLNQ